MSPKLSSTSWNRLIATFRGVPWDSRDALSKPPVPFGDALRGFLQHQKPCSSRREVLSLLRNHWEDWFEGTAFVRCYPQKLDRSDMLWLKTPDAILRQRLQFRLPSLMGFLQQLLPQKIKEVRLL